MRALIAILDVERPGRRPTYLALAYLALGLFTALALIPRPPSLDVTHADKAAHLLAFAAASGLATLGSRSLRAALSHAATFLVAGGVIEVLQDTFAPQRDGSWADAAANAVGVVLGVAAGRLALRAMRAIRVSSDSGQ